MKRQPEQRERKSHIWAREENEHYVEPAWCSKRLFEEERFEGEIWDPACGFGTIIESAKAVGLQTTASDLVDRGYADMWRRESDFLRFDGESIRNDNIVTNPPFNIAPQFAAQALKIALKKAAIIFPTARLNAAHWLKGTPLKTVWLLSPRPSMPPGYVIARGEKPGGGKMDFCWLVFDHAHTGPAELRWLYRDKQP